MTLKSLFTAGAAGTMLMACGAGAVPTNEVSSAKAAVQSAEAVGARNEPKAALHLKMARDQMRQAEALINSNDIDEAKMALQRAETDARLSLVLTHEADARRKAQQALKRLDELKQEARRASAAAATTTMK